MKKGILLLILLILPWATSQNENRCTNAPGGLCEGYDSPTCTTSIIAGCNGYPRCLYSGTIDGYFCNHNCIDTGVQANCGTGRRCLCTFRTPCTLCTYSGLDLNACSNNGCGPADATPPVVNIVTPVNNLQTTVMPITLTGTATDDNVVSNLQFVNARIPTAVGGRGQQTGTEQWMFEYVNLEPGSNVITVTATDGFGRQGTDAVTVNYYPPTSPSHPSISISESATDYVVSISDPNVLNAQYAWGTRPNVYFLVPFATNSNPVLSAIEQRRLSYLQNNIASWWDIITENKHPLNFVFMDPYVIPDYNTADNSMFQYLTKAINAMDFTPEAPYILVFMYPEPYWDQSMINMWNSKDKMAEVYLANFNDAMPDSDEVFLNIALHELVHNFARVPNNNDVPGGPTLFWMGHPAGFYGAVESCDEGTMHYDCKPYGAIQSPTGQEGYYEAYSILSIIRTGLLKQNLGGRYPELSPLEQMGMGIRSKYDDAPYLYYSGYLSGSGTSRIFTVTQVSDYGYSSKWLHDYTWIESHPTDYWDIRFDSPKTTLGNVRSFNVAKSGQFGRSLIVYASDAQNPGHFKVFNNNAASTIGGADNTPPSAVANLAAAVHGYTVTLTWSPATDNFGVTGYEVSRMGTILDTIPGTQYIEYNVPAGVYTYTVVAIDNSQNRGPSSNIQALVPIHESDTNPVNGCVEVAELVTYIDNWKISTLITINDVHDAINYWLEDCWYIIT